LPGTYYDGKKSFRMDAIAAGPNRVGPAGMFQTAADTLKLNRKRRNDAGWSG